MKQVTNGEIAAFHEGGQKYLTLLFSDGTRIETEDIVEESMQFTQSIDSGGQIHFGAGSAAQIRVGVFATTKRYQGLRMTVTISAGLYTRTLGTFTIASDIISSDGEYRELVGYDDLSSILQQDFSDWHNSLSFPMTVGQYRAAFATACGLTTQSVSLVNDSVTIERNFTAQSYSGKNVLDAICSINGCFAIINSDGQLQYIQLPVPVDGLYPANNLYPANDLYPRDWANPGDGTEYDLGSLFHEEYSCDNITGVQIRMTEDDIGAMAGTNGNVYVIQDNPLMYGKTSAQLQAVGTALLAHISPITYTPASLTAKASPWFELGDAIRIQTRKQVIYSLILQRTMDGISALADTYSASGEKTREENTNSMSQKLDALKWAAHELVVTQSELSSRIEEVNTDLNGQTSALSSRITQTVTLIETEVTRATTAEGTLSSRITQTADAISSEVTRATGAESSLSSRITQTATDITSEVTRATGAESSLSTRITQTATDISSEVTRATGAESSLSTRISQTATDITSEVTRAQTAEKAIMADYVNTYAPATNNSPASGWTDDNTKAQHIGEIFYNKSTGKYYEWQCDGVVVNFSDRCSTEGNVSSQTPYDRVSVYYYDGTQYQRSKWLTGGYNGTENGIAGAKVFVPKSTLYIQWVTDQSQVDWGFKIDSITRTTGKTENVATALSITVTEPVISGVTNLPESDHPYTNNISKVYQINTGINVNGYHWEELGTAQSEALRSVIRQAADEVSHEVEDSVRGLSTSIKQTVDTISLDVSNGSTSSTLTIKAGDTVLDSENITFSGFVTFTGLSGGTTTIDGGCMKTGKIMDANQLADAHMILNLETGVITTEDVTEYSEVIAGYTYTTIAGERAVFNRGNITVSYFDYYGREGATPTRNNNRYIDISSGKILFYAAYKRNEYESTIGPRLNSNDLATKNLEIVTNMLYINQYAGDTGSAPVKCGRVTSSGSGSFSGSVTCSGVYANGGVHDVTAVEGDGSSDLTINAMGRGLNLWGVDWLNVNGDSCNGFTGWFSDNNFGAGVRTTDGGACDIRFVHGIVVEGSRW